MSALPAGVERRTVGGVEGLVTRGEPIYDEPAEDGWRLWSTDRSKLAGMIERGLDTGLSAEARVLYLGAASGTTVSHVADISRIVYAVEFAPRPMRDLLDVAATKGNVIPLLKDARRPETYAHVVEADVDVLIQDVATRGQADVALGNRRFLADDGRLVLAIKARSEDVTRRAEHVFRDARKALAAGYEIESSTRLEPEHVDHLAITGRPLG